MALPVPEPGLVIRYAYLWRIPHAKPGQDFAYGLMPGALFRQVRDKFVARARARRDHPVNRDDPG